MVSRPWSQDFRAAQAVADSTFHRQKLFRACLFRSILLARLVLRGEPSYTSYTRVSHPPTYTTLPYTFTPLECKSLWLLILFFSFFIYLSYRFNRFNRFSDKYIIYTSSHFESWVIVLVFPFLYDGNFSNQWFRRDGFVIQWYDVDVGEKMRKNIFLVFVAVPWIDMYHGEGGGRRIWWKIRVWKWNPVKMEFFGS